jgi:hypothetical protein
MAMARRAFITATIVWAVLVVMAPFAATQSSPGSVWYATAFAVYGAGRYICHQLPQRSFYLWTAQLPVCARCTGIYLGGALAAVVAAARPWWTDPVGEKPRVNTARPSPSKRRHKGWQRRSVPRPRTTMAVALDRLGLESSRARVLLAVAAVPTALTLVYEWTTGDRPSNMIRALSGAPLGAAIVLILAAALLVVVPAVPAAAPVARRVN